MKIVGLLVPSYSTVPEPYVKLDPRFVGVPDISKKPAPPKVIVPPVASKSPSASYFPVLVLDTLPLLSEVPLAVHKPEDIDKVLDDAIVTVLPDATSALLAPIASSPSVTVQSPLTSHSLHADFAP